MADKIIFLIFDRELENEKQNSWQFNIQAKAHCFSGTVPLDINIFCETVPLNINIVLVTCFGQHRPFKYQFFLVKPSHKISALFSAIENN